MKSLEAMRKAITGNSGIVSIGHVSVPQEGMHPMRVTEPIDMDEAVQMVTDGAIAGIAFDRVQPSATGHVFGLVGSLVYVDYGLPDREESRGEFLKRLADGMHVLDAQTDGHSITWSPRT